MKKLLAVAAIAGGLYLATRKKKSTTTSTQSGGVYSQYEGKIFGVSETGQWFVVKNNKRFYANENWLKTYPETNLGGDITLSDVSWMPIVGHVGDDFSFTETGVYDDPTSNFATTRTATSGTCRRRNEDGSHTTYTAQGRDCPYGGTFQPTRLTQEVLGMPSFV